LLLRSSVVHADTKLQVVATAGLGYTDNIHSSPATPVPGVPAREAGAYAVVSPGLVLATEQQNFLQRLTYTYTADLFFGASSANTYANRLEWNGFVVPSPTTSLSLTAGVAQSSYDTANRQTSAATTAVAAALPGTGSFVDATTGEEFAAEVSPVWTLMQGTHLELGTPLGSAPSAPTSFLADEHVGGERAWRHDAAGVDVRVGYSVVSNAVNLDGTPAGTLHQLTNAMVLTWRHDFGRYFASRAEAGEEVFLQLTRHSQLWTPTVLLLIGYAREEGSAQLSYSHTAALDVMLGQALLADEVRLSGAVPFDRHARWVLSASTGYQHGRLVGTTGELATHVNVLLADAALSWQALDQLALSARYQHFDQRSGAAQPPLPLSFVRNTVMLTATLEIPRSQDMPRPYRAPRRVDRSDELGLQRSAQDPLEGR
jgi:hypothetical protein